MIAKMNVQIALALSNIEIYYHIRKKKISYKSLHVVIFIQSSIIVEDL